METIPKFNMRQCLDYINIMEDFTIEFERKPSIDVQSKLITYMGETISIKVYLRRFLIECKKESAMVEYDFIEWLNERKLFWRNQQYRIVGALTDRAELLQPAYKAEIENKKQRYLQFFQHNYKLIDMIETDILNSLEQSVVYIQPADILQRPHSSPCTLSSFDELFKEGIDPAPYYQLLRDHEYPLIGNDFNFISKALKSGFCVWIYELQKNNIINRQPDKIYAELLLKKIKGLKTFSESMFRKLNNAAEERYGEWFRRGIEEMKKQSHSAAKR